MKLKNLIKVLHHEAVIYLTDYNKVDLTVKVKNIPKELKERQVDKVYTTRSDILYDLYIELKS